MWRVIEGSRKENEVAEAMPAGDGVLVRTIIAEVVTSGYSNSVALCYIPHSHLKLVSTDPDRVSIEAGLAP